MHGGRHSRTTMDSLMIQKMAYDITQQQNGKITTLNLDATKCYDHIFPSIATMAMARLGIAQQFGETIDRILKNMKHTICMGHGISSECIQQQKDELWSGIGQGSAAAGPAWIAIEAFMLQYVTQKCSGVKFTCPDRDTEFRVHTIGYIDNNNLLINDEHEQEMNKKNQQDTCSME